MIHRPVPQQGGVARQTCYSNVHQNLTNIFNPEKPLLRQAGTNDIFALSLAILVYSLVI
jgi:hypothetical protein